MTFGKAQDENPKQGTLGLTSHTAHRIAAATMAADPGAHEAIPTEVEAIREVTIVNHRRPVAAEPTNVVGLTDPVPTIHEIHRCVLDVTGSTES